MSDLSVANIIRDQLGNRALFMLGAKDLLGSETEKSLSFRVRGSPTVNHIRIALAPNDTYTVTFSKVRGLKVKEVAKLEDVYVDSLHRVIEKNTGLYTSL